MDMKRKDLKELDDMIKMVDQGFMRAAVICRAGGYYAVPFSQVNMFERDYMEMEIGDWGRRYMCYRHKYPQSLPLYDVKGRRVCLFHEDDKYFLAPADKFDYPHSAKLSLVDQIRYVVRDLDAVPLYVNRLFVSQTIQNMEKMKQPPFQLYQKGKKIHPWYENTGFKFYAGTDRRDGSFTGGSLYQRIRDGLIEVRPTDENALVVRTVYNDTYVIPAGLADRLDNALQAGATPRGIEDMFGRYKYKLPAGKVWSYVYLGLFNDKGVEFDYERYRRMMVPSSVDHWRIQKDGGEWVFDLPTAYWPACGEDINETATSVRIFTEIDTMVVAIKLAHPLEVTIDKSPRVHRLRFTEKDILTQWSISLDHGSPFSFHFPDSPSQL